MGFGRVGGIGVGGVGVGGVGVGVGGGFLVLPKLV